MLTLKEAGNIIEKALKNTDFPEKPENLYEPVKYILSNGGKRIRPSLVLLAANVYTNNYLKALEPALGVEIFHNFTLLHDDLMDNSPIRRNKPTVHEKWESNIAILSGDAMSIIASQYITKVDDSILRQVTDHFNSTAVEVCEGQMMDMDFENRWDVTVDEYIRMISLKTSVLIAAGLKIGALIGGAPEKEADILYNYGLNLGIAFQLQDDYLDSFGDSGTFGKKIGNDIVTNKKTYLMINALKLSDRNDHLRLTELLSTENIDPAQKISEVLSFFKKYGIKEKTQSEIRNYFNKAVSCLNNIEVPDRRKELLRQFPEMLMKRDY